MSLLSSPVQNTIRQNVARLWQKRRLPQLAQRTCELYLQDHGTQAQTHCQEILQTQVRIDAQTVERFFRTDIGEAILQRLGQLIDLPNSTADRLALVKRIAQVDQLSLMGLLSQLAGGLRSDRLLETAQQVDLLLRTTNELLTLLHQLMHQEAVGQISPPSDLRLPGPWGIRQRVLRLKRRSSQPFDVFLYEPWGDPTIAINAATNVVVSSHGLAATPQAMAHYAKHLASHGYLVAIPQHPGSDSHQVRSLLSGHVDEVFSLQEFFDRPQDISLVLDELERRNDHDYGGHLNLTAVGILGESFGGYTALALAGATINFEELAQHCDRISDSLNASLLLQCRALSLPPTSMTLQDARIAAIFTIDPIGSGLFGADGLTNVTIPTVIATGSNDKTVPMALEPLQLFPHLGSPDRFLAVIRGKSHVQDLSTLLSSLKLLTDTDLPSLQLSPPIVDSYIYGLSLLFFQRYLSASPPVEGLAAYAQSISQSPYDLYLVSAGSSPTLEPVLDSFQRRLAQLKWQTITVQYQDGMFTAADGFSLYYQSWLPTVPIKATVILVHGLGAHSGVFKNVVKALLPEGYAIYGYDLRGHGRSPGQRGHIHRWADYRHDLAHFVAMVQEHHGLIPCFLISHSLGSIIALDYIRHRLLIPGASRDDLRYPPVAGIVVASPPFGIHSTTEFRLKLGQLLSLGWPRFSMSCGLNHIPPSRDRSVVLAYAHDALRHQRGTARLATEFLKTTEQLQQDKSDLTLPILMLHGTADQVASYNVGQAFFQGLPQENATFIGYNGAYHELYNESNQAEIMQDIHAWLQMHIP